MCTDAPRSLVTLPISLCVCGTSCIVFVLLSIVVLLCWISFDRESLHLSFDTKCSSQRGKMGGGSSREGSRSVDGVRGRGSFFCLAVHSPSSGDVFLVDSMQSATVNTVVWGAFDSDSFASTLYHQMLLCRSMACPPFCRRVSQQPCILLLSGWILIEISSCSSRKRGPTCLIHMGKNRNRSETVIILCSTFAHKLLHCVTTKTSLLKPLTSPRDRFVFYMLHVFVS